MLDIQNQYLPILIFFIISLSLALLLVIIPFLISGIRGYSAKTSPYECGFESFDNNRSLFDIRFYLVSILFIIFDLEVAMIFPWAMALKYIGLLGFLSMISFLAILAIGFIYEWKKGALDWE